MPLKKILLIIKAQNFHQVKSEAQKRGMHISDICNLNPTEFRARTHNFNALKVQKWFNETNAKDANLIPHFGFPIGTLLYFRIED